MKKELKIGIFIGIIIFIIILIVGICVQNFYYKKYLKYEGLNFDEEYYNNIFLKRESQILNYNKDGDNTFKINDELNMKLISAIYSYNKIELAVEFKFNENIYPDLASLKFNSYIYDDNYVVIEDGDNPGTPFQFTSRYFYEENKNLINMSYNEYMDYGWDILTPRDNNFGSENIIDVENNLVTCKFLIEDTVGALKNFPVLNLSIRDIEYKKFSDDIINKEYIQNITSSLTSIGNKEYIFNITR